MPLERLKTKVAGRGTAGEALAWITAQPTARTLSVTTNRGKSERGPVIRECLKARSWGPVIHDCDDRADKSVIDLTMEKKATLLILLSTVEECRKTSPSYCYRVEKNGS